MTGTLTQSAKRPEGVIHELHRKFLSEARPPEAFRPVNSAGISRFETLGFPHRKHEMYTFVNTQPLVNTGFALQKPGKIASDAVRPYLYPGCETSHLVLVDGTFRPDLSDTSALGDGVRAVGLEQSAGEEPLRHYLLETIEAEDDVFAAINAAFLSGGLHLEVMPRFTASAPLQILVLSSGSVSGSVVTCPRLFVQVGELAEIGLIVRFAGTGGNYFVNTVIDVRVSEGAGVRYSQIQQDNETCWHFSKTRVRLARNGRFLSTHASSGCRLARHHYEVDLDDVGGELRLNGLSVISREEQVHNYVRIHHRAPNCTSHQFFRNIISHRARSSVDGTVIVDPGAQQTQSDQLINNLMLTDEGHADNKPNLMIFADDVKCTHGATVGQIDENQIFYLKTRGLTEAAAKSLLTRSFAESVLESIDFPAVREDLENTLLKKLEASHG